MTDSPPAKRKCEDVEDNIIRFRIENAVKQLANPIELSSSKKIIGGFPWILNVVIGKNSFNSDDDAYYLRLNVYCEKSDESNVWFCDASIALTLVNQGDAAESIIMSFDKRFSSYVGEGFPTFCLASEVLDISEGFLKDNSIVVETRINIKSGSGDRFRSRDKVDFFAPSELSDVILVVEKKKFHVSKQLLAIHSSFFKGLFFREFKESKQKNIPLPETSAYEFETLLEILYRTGKKCDEDSVEFVLKLADKFDMKIVIDDAETYLLGEEDMDLNHKLRLSDQYRLHTLMGQCLDQYTSCDILEDLRKSNEYSLLSEKMKDILFDKYIELSKAKKDESGDT